MTVPSIHKRSCSIPVLTPDSLRLPFSFIFSITVPFSYRQAKISQIGKKGARALRKGSAGSPREVLEESVLLVQDSERSILDSQFRHVLVLLQDSGNIWGTFSLETLDKRRTQVSWVGVGLQAGAQHKVFPSCGRD